MALPVIFLGFISSQLKKFENRNISYQTNESGNYGRKINPFLEFFILVKNDTRKNYYHFFKEKKLNRVKFEREFPDFLLQSLLDRIVNGNAES